MPTAVTVSGAANQVIARGFRTPGMPINQYVEAGVRRALQGSVQWPFLRKTLTGYVPGTAIADLRAVALVLDSQGRKLRWKSRDWWVEAGYDVTRAGSAIGWYVGRTAATTPLPAVQTMYIDTNPVTVDYFQRASTAAWFAIPEEFIDVIVDAACLAAAKDANDWEMVAGLRDEIREQQGILLEQYVDEQLSDSDVIIADLFD